MKILLEISFYLFLGLIIFGTFLLIWILRWIFGEKDILYTFPHTKTLPIPALLELKKLMKKVQEKVPKAPQNQKNYLLKDLKLLDRIIEEIESRGKYQQTKYNKLCEEREEVWAHIKEVFDNMSKWQQLFGKKRDFEYSKSIEYYQNLEQQIADATEHVKFQGELLLAEVKSRPVFERNYHLLYPSKRKKPSNQNYSSNEQNLQAPTKIAQVEDSETSKDNTEKEEGLPIDNNTTSTKETNPALKELTQTSFPKAGVNLKNHKYTDSTFSLSFEESGILRHFDFENCLFKKIHFEGTHQYDHCSFRNANFSESSWLKESQIHRFDQCDFTGAIFTKCRLNYAVFDHCHFDHANLEGVHLNKVKFVSCTMNEIHWNGIDLSQTVMSKEMLTSLNFSKCNAPPQNYVDSSKSDDEIQNNTIDQTNKNQSDKLSSDNNFIPEET